MNDEEKENQNEEKIPNPIFSKLDLIDKKEKEESELITQKIAKTQESPSNEEPSSEKPRSKVSFVKVMENLKGLEILKKDFLLKGKNDEAIKTAKKMIQFAEMLNIKQVINEETEFIKQFEQKGPQEPPKTSKKLKKTQIKGLQQIKQDHYVKENFKEAKKSSEKILVIAEKYGFKKIIKQEKEFQENLEMKVENTEIEKVEEEEIPKFSSKMELLEYITKLHVERDELFNRVEYQQAYKVSKKIIQLATENDLGSVIKEEKKFVYNLLMKARRKKLLDGLEETINETKERIQELIELRNFANAQVVLKLFEKQYAQFNDLERIQRFLSEMKMELAKKQAGTKGTNPVKESQIVLEKDTKIIIEKTNSDIEKKEISEEITISGVADTSKQDLVKGNEVIGNQNAALQQGFEQLNNERAEFEQKKKELELLKNDLQKKKYELEEGFARLHAEYAELEEMKKTYQQIKEMLEQQKMELEEGFAQLESKRARLHEGQFE